MIKNCLGCFEDYMYACQLVREGYHLAMTVDRPVNLEEGVEHFIIFLVNEEGEIIVW